MKTSKYKITLEVDVIEDDRIFSKEIMKIQLANIFKGYMLMTKMSSIVALSSTVEEIPKAKPS